MFISWLDHYRLGARAFASIEPHATAADALARGRRTLRELEAALAAQGIDPAHVVVRVEREACR